MNCYQHPDVPAVAYCRQCGRAVCAACQRPAEGTVFCPDHAVASAGPYATSGAASAAFTASASASNPYTAPAAAPPAAPASLQTSPGLAFLLGLIPGVGAIYNGQYVKGLVHAVIFGLLVSITNASDGGPGHDFLGICLMAFFCYMPFEAFHTARKRQLGVPVDEWSSLMAQSQLTNSVPIGPLVLIGVGVLFLLESLHVLDFRVIGRFWPVILIIIGVAMLAGRLRPRAPVPPPVGVPPIHPDLAGDRS